MSRHSLRLGRSRPLGSRQAALRELPPGIDAARLPVARSTRRRTGDELHDCIREGPSVWSSSASSPPLVFARAERHRGDRSPTVVVEIVNSTTVAGRRELFVISGWAQASRLGTRAPIPRASELASAHWPGGTQDSCGAWKPVPAAMLSPDCSCNQPRYPHFPRARRA